MRSSDSQCEHSDDRSRGRNSTTLVVEVAHAPLRA
jgi:hypothetical protein